MNEGSFLIHTFYDTIRDRYSVSVRHRGVLVHHSGAAEYLNNNLAYAAGESIVASILEGDQ